MKKSKKKVGIVLAILFASSSSMAMNSPQMILHAVETGPAVQDQTKAMMNECTVDDFGFVTVYKASGFDEKGLPIGLDRSTKILEMGDLNALKTEITAASNGSYNEGTWACGTGSVEVTAYDATEDNTFDIFAARDCNGIRTNTAPEAQKLLISMRDWCGLALVAPMPSPSPMPSATPMPTMTPMPSATPVAMPSATPMPTMTPVPMPTITPVPTEESTTAVHHSVRDFFRRWLHL